MLDSLPRYLEIQRDLQAQIASGAWPPGSRVPPEHELQEHYACSRMTVNKALSALARSGLVVRKRRAGSFVAAPKSQQTILKIHDIKAEILASNRPYRFEVLSRQIRAMSAEDAERLGVPKAGRVLALVVRHLAGEQPFVFEERLIDLSMAPTAETEVFESVPPGSWLLTLVPWTNAEHIIRADLATAQMAKMLDIPAKSSCLIVERRTWQGGQTITWVRLTYPGERHQLTSHFSPGDRIAD